MAPEQPNQNGTATQPRLTETRKVAPGPESDQSDVAGRIASIRAEVFDLVEELHDRDGNRWTELERASEQMQVIANRLAKVEALVASAAR